MTENFLKWDEAIGELPIAHANLVMGNLIDAQKYAKKILENNDKDSLEANPIFLYYNTIICLKILGEYNKFEIHKKELLNLDNIPPEIYFGYYKFLLSMNEQQKVINQVTNDIAIISIPENKIKAYSILGSAYYSIKKYDLAAKNFDSAFDQINDPKYLNNAACCYFLDGKKDKSMRYFNLLEKKGLNNIIINQNINYSHLINTELKDLPQTLFLFMEGNKFGNYHTSLFSIITKKLDDENHPLNSKEHYYHFCLDLLSKKYGSSLFHFKKCELLENNYSKDFNDHLTASFLGDIDENILKMFKDRNISIFDVLFHFANPENIAKHIEETYNEPSLILEFIKLYSKIMSNSEQNLINQLINLAKQYPNKFKKFLSICNEVKIIYRDNQIAEKLFEMANDEYSNIVEYNLHPYKFSEDPSPKIIHECSELALILITDNDFLMEKFADLNKKIRSEKSINRAEIFYDLLLLKDPDNKKYICGKNNCIKKRQQLSNYNDRSERKEIKKKPKKISPQEKNYLIGQKRNHRKKSE